MAQRILALEMVGDCVRAAAAERSWNSFQLLGVYEKFRANDEPDLGGALARLVAAAGPSDVVISALPSDRVAKRLLDLPFKDQRRLHQVVPFALEEHLPFPVDNATVAFTRVGIVDDHSLVLAAMVRKADLQNHLDLLSKAGLDPKTVTLAPLALASLFSRARNGTAPSAHVVVEGDESSTSVVLVDAAGKPLAMRSMNSGLMRTDGSVVSQDQSTSILNTVRQTMLAHSDEMEQADVIMAGSAATVPGVRKLLAESLALAVRDGGDFDYSTVFEGKVPEARKFAGCVAMLLGELPTRPAQLINFRAGEFVFRGRVRGDLSPFYTSAILAAALLGVVVLYFVLGMSANLRRLNRVNRQIAAVAAPVLGQEPDPSEAREELQAGIVKMNKRLRLIGGNLSRNSPLEILMVVSRALPANFPVEMLDVQIDANGMHVTGQADSFSTVDQAKKALDRSGYFGQIEVAHAKAGSDPNKVDFRLDASFKGIELAPKDARGRE